MTQEELDLVEQLGEIHTRFVKLPDSHPSDNIEFCHHIHILQRHIMARETRRINPDIFPQKINY